MTSFAVAGTLMVASGSIHAVVNAILKGGRDKITGRAVIDGSSALILLPAIAFVPLPAGAWGWIAISALVHAAYLYALVRAFGEAEFSAAYPILRGTAPLVTALISILFVGERVAAPTMIGIVLIGGAIALLAFGRHIGRGALGWSLLTGVMIALYTVIDAQGVRAAPDAFSFIVWIFVATGLSAVTMFAVISRGAIFAAARVQWRPGVIAGFLSVLTYGTALFALRIGPTAPLAALRETGMVSALAISVLFLGERVDARRLIAVSGIVAGAVTILATSS